MTVIPATQLELRRSSAAVSDPLATNDLPPTSNDIILLSGPLDDFLAYSCLEHAKWLIDIAHDICDPLAQRGSLFVWDAAAQRFPLVAPTDPLVASVYRYVMPGRHSVSLSKISLREGRSKTTTTLGGDGAMADRVKRRDGRCWVSPVYGQALTNSHIVPKRMGDQLACVIVNTFAPSPAPIPNLSIYDEMFGISLNKNLDPYFINYELGLRLVSQKQYECHVFAVASPGRAITIYGETDAGLPTLHGRVISPPQATHPQNPPAGLFRWHYLQCVLKKFAHTDYRNQLNIHYSELPIPMQGDSDDDDTDSDADWPSAALDRGRAVEAERRYEQEHLHSTADWIAKQ
ncbi:hypothetical protein B0H11DRAFT_1873644 [Mycena galericulata]|nr:hypothetical protein B0H11DRAFT_1873644 [Mycena galericulata]